MSVIEHPDAASWCTTISTASRGRTAPVVLAGIGSSSDGEIWTWKLAQVAASKFDGDDLPILPDAPKDSMSASTAKLPKRRWT